MRELAKGTWARGELDKDAHTLSLTHTPRAHLLTYTYRLHAHPKLVAAGRL